MVARKQIRKARLQIKKEFAQLYKEIKQLYREQNRLRSKERALESKLSGLQIDCKHPNVKVVGVKKVNERPYGARFCPDCEKWNPYEEPREPTGGV